MSSNAFDHDELNVELYLGEATAFAIGRLLARLEWRLKQGVLLSGPLTRLGDCSLLDVLENKQPNTFKTSKMAKTSKKTQKANGSNRFRNLWSPIIGQLNDRMATECSRHHASAKKLALLVANFVSQLEIPDVFNVASNFDESLNSVLLQANTDDVAEDVADANERFREFCRDKPNDPSDEPAWHAADRALRKRLCREITNKYVVVPLWRAVDVLTKQMTERQRQMLVLGRDLEQGSHPAAVDAYLVRLPRRAVLKFHEPLHETDFDVVGQGLIAYECRQPCDFYPDASWIQKIQFAIKRLRIRKNQVDQKISEALESFNSRQLSPEIVKQLIDTVDYWLVEPVLQNRGPDGRNAEAPKPEVIRLAYDVMLEVLPSGKSGILRRHKNEANLESTWEIRFAKTLLQVGDREITYEELRSPSGKRSRSTQRDKLDNSVQTRMSDMKKILRKLGLEIENIRRTGYRVQPISKLPFK